MLTSKFTQTIGFAVVMFTATVNAHSNMILPEPTWPDGFYSRNSPSGTIDGPSALTCPEGMTFGGDSASNTAAFTKAFKNSEYKDKSLRDFVAAKETLSDGATKECGFSLINGKPQELPDQVEWNELTPSHQGPCEIWCDNTLVFKDENCATNYPGNPAKLPYDKAKCAGKNVLTSIWLALHVPTWQVYTNCAPLTGGTSNTSNDNSTTPASMPVNTSTSTTSNAPASTTSNAPVSTGSNAPVAPTATQATTSTTAAEADVKEESVGTVAPKSSCRRRLRK